MTKEKAKLVHLRARKLVLEEQLADATMDEDYEKFQRVFSELDNVENHIEVQENYLNEGFNTKVKNTTTVPSSVGNYIPLT